MYEILRGLLRQQWLREDRTSSFPLQPSLRDCSCVLMPTQDFIQDAILGYFQPSLRDWGARNLMGPSNPDGDGAPDRFA